MYSSPRTACATGTSSGPISATGLLLKARLINERHEAIEQFAFSDIQLGAKLDREMVKPPFATLPPDWQVRELPSGGPRFQGHGLGGQGSACRISARSLKVIATLRGKTRPVAHLVYSDGLVSISVFVEPTPSAPQPVGLSQQGGINVYSSATRRLSGDGAGRSARHYRPPDCLFGHPSADHLADGTSASTLGHVDHLVAMTSS